MILLAIDFYQRALFATTETMGTMKMNQMPQVLLIQILFDNLYQAFVSPGETRTPKADLNINSLIHINLLR